MGPEYLRTALRIIFSVSRDMSIATRGMSQTGALDDNFPQILFSNRSRIRDIRNYEKSVVWFFCGMLIRQRCPQRAGYATENRKEPNCDDRAAPAIQCFHFND